MKHRSLEERKKDLDRKKEILDAKIERNKLNEKIKNLRKKK